MRTDEARDREPEIGEVVPAERRLAETRAEIEELLIPPPDEFPRSQTMRFLMGRNGKAVAIGAAVALLAVKPRLAATVMRFVPLGRIAQRFL